MRKLNVIILAAGKGTRMYSTFPKVLHLLAGRPLIKRIIDTVEQLDYHRFNIICGFGASHVKQLLNNYTINFIEQKEQQGTGHAVKQAVPFIDDEEDVLILYGDVPLITVNTLNRLQKNKPQEGIALLTAFTDHPTGYGRIIREQKDKHIIEIVEEKDTTDSQKMISEINTGILMADGYNLKRWLNKLNNNNAQQEYYLTDIIKFAYLENKPIVAVHPDHFYEIEGINDKQQLAKMERTYQQINVQQLMANGVTFYDPQRFDLRGKLEHGKDVIIDCNVIIEGHVILGNHVTIGAGCILKDCIIADNSIISPYTIIEQSQLQQSCTVGPFARLRAGNYLGNDVHIGNFVELKKSTLGKGTKAGHLTYLGDANIGENVNIGAGTITCNYDGANKFTTTIGNNVFVGSDSQFIAPVTIADGATIAAGTTITDDVAENELVISRIRQKHITGWQRPQKNKS